MEQIHNSVAPPKVSRAIENPLVITLVLWLRRVKGKWRKDGVSAERGPVKQIVYRRTQFREPDVESDRGESSSSTSEPVGAIRPPLADAKVQLFHDENAHGKTAHAPRYDKWRRRRTVRVAQMPPPKRPRRCNLGQPSLTHYSSDSRLHRTKLPMRIGGGMRF